MKIKALLVLLTLCLLVSSFMGCSSKPYNYDLSKYIKLGDYDGMTVLESDIVDGILDYYHDACSKDSKTTTYTKDTEGVKDIYVEDGDVVNIDYVGAIDGEKFEGGSATGSNVTIGSDTFTYGGEEFEDGLIDAAVGEKFEIKVTIPQDHAKTELRGKEAVFTVTVNSITRTTYPEYNDENIDKYTDFETVAAFEEEYRDTVIKNLLWADLYENSKVIKYPEKELKEYYNAYVDSYTSTAASLGVSLETYISSYYSQYVNTQIKDVTSFFQYLAAYSKSQVKQELILYAMLDAEPVLLMTDADYATRSYQLWEEYVEENNYEGTYDDFLDDYERTSIEKTIYYDIIIEFIQSTCVIEDDVTKNGLVTNRFGTRYYIDNVMQTGWMNIDINDDGELEKVYFNEETGYLTVGGGYAIPEEGGDKLFYEFTDEGVFVGIYNGFYTSNAGKMYFTDGVYLTGWQEIEGDKYYFFETGYAACGDEEVKDESGKNILGRFTDEGIYEYQLIGWIKTDAGIRYYYPEDGKVTYATRKYEYPYNGKTYLLYFAGKDGYIVAPTEKDTVVKDTTYGKVFANINESVLYLFYEVELDGQKVYAILTEYTGFYKIDDNNTYYFVNGEGLTGWQLIDGDMYYFSCENSSMFTDNKTIEGVEYTFGKDGKLTTKLNGIVYDEGKRFKYYTNNVYSVNELVTVDEAKYYFGEDGFAESDWIDVDGDGIKDYYADTKSSVIAVNTTLTIDGVSYVFDAEGKFTVSENTEDGK